MSEPTAPTGGTQRTPGHEPTVVSGWSMFLSALGLAFIVLTGLAVTAGLWAWLRSDEGQPKTPFAVPTAASQPPGRSAVDLNPHQRKSRLEFERQQQELLTSYGWVNREKQLAHIPIERAMRIIVEERTEKE